MKAKPSDSKRPRKLSFSVDRGDIEISTDWASAVIEQCRPHETLAAVASIATGVPDVAVSRKFGPINEAQPPTIGSIAVLGTPGEVQAAGDRSATGDVIAAGEGSTAGEAITTDAVHTPVAQVSVLASETPLANRAEQLGTTVANSAPVADETTHTHLSTVALWPDSSRRVLRSFADGLTPGQFTLYTVMYQNGDDTEDVGDRIFRGGYSDLGKLAGLSKRGIQNIVDSLLQKGAVAIEHAPGYHRTQTTVYRVHSPERVFQSWRDAGYRYVISKGRHLVQ